MRRCRWVDKNSELYKNYHDHEWGVPKYDDHELFELLVLESFQAGLSWLTVLRKRAAFRKAFDNFELKKVAAYDENKIAELLGNKDIIRSRGKIAAAINNASDKFINHLPILCFNFSPLFPLVHFSLFWFSFQISHKAFLQ